MKPTLRPAGLAFSPSPGRKTRADRGLRNEPCRDGTSLCRFKVSSLQGSFGYNPLSTRTPYWGEV